MLAYNIADTKINIQSDNDYLINRLKPFMVDGSNAADLSVEICKCEHINEPSGKLVIEDKVRWLRKSEEKNGFHILRKDESDSHVMAHLDIDEEWSLANIKCLKLNMPSSSTVSNMMDWAEFYSFMLTGIVFRNHLLHRNGLVIHASSIAWNDKGLLFTAPSGTGKSTHVRLWEKYMGASVTVINDDTPAIRFIDEVPILCGTPWSGSSDKFANIKVPLAAMVVLEQAPENSIRKLSAAEALPRIMPRSFLPYFDDKLMEKAYNVLDKLIQVVPVYHLRCTPDREAMELVYQCVK